MLKSWLSIGLSMVLLSIPINAKTITLSMDNKLDYNFTNNYRLSFSENAFSLSNIKIKPIISLNSKEYDLSSFNKNIIINDNSYNYEFGFKINDVSLSQINYISFELKGLKKLDDVSYTDGKIRVIFDDLTNKGNMQLLDNKIILYNPTTTTIDPIIELLPNSTNKAYYNTSFDTTCNRWTMINEFTQTNYNSTNVSDNNRYLQTLGSIISTFRCNYYKFTFNTTGIDKTTITSILFYHEGYYTSTCELGECDSELYYFNVSSNSWVFWDIININSETVKTKSFSDYSQLIDNNNITQFGIKLFTGWFTNKAINSYTDFSYANITYTSPPINTCTYSGSGNWFININDNCTLSTMNIVNGMIEFYGSNGFCNFKANQYAHSFHYNVTSLGKWYYNNYRWVY